ASVCAVSGLLLRAARWRVFVLRLPRRLRISVSVSSAVLLSLPPRSDYSAARCLARRAVVRAAGRATLLGNQPGPASAAEATARGRGRARKAGDRAAVKRGGARAGAALDRVWRHAIRGRELRRRS